MAHVSVQTESEIDQGWSFEIDIAPSPDAKPERWTLKLSWADYDHWAHGTVAPERVARAVALFIISKGAASQLAPDFDASLVRRKFPEIDAELSALL